MYKTKHKCLSCSCECTVSEETFEYSGTHCNNGNSGTHRTGNYTSDCCDSDFVEDSPGCTDQD